MLLNYILYVCNVRIINFLLLYYYIILFYLYIFIINFNAILFLITQRKKEGVV